MYIYIYIYIGRGERGNFKEEEGRRKVLDGFGGKGGV